MRRRKNRALCLTLLDEKLCGLALSSSKQNIIFKLIVKQCVSEYLRQTLDLV